MAGNSLFRKPEIHLCTQFNEPNGSVVVTRDHGWKRNIREGGGREVVEVSELNATRKKYPIRVWRRNIMPM